MTEGKLNHVESPTYYMEDFGLKGPITLEFYFFMLNYLIVSGSQLPTGYIHWTIFPAENFCLYTV